MNVLPILDKMYENIDIRCILVKSQDNTWHSAFLKIYFTKESNENVLHIYKKKEPFRTILKDARLMLVSECKDISESETIFNEIEKGEITISGIPIDLLSEQSKNIFSHSLLSNEHVVDLYTTAEQRNGYSQKFLCLATDSTPSQILSRYGVSLTEENQDIFVFLHPTICL
jgi:hypothetical protein